ncbi:MAG: hypothetical protein ABSG79_15720 [Bryobacteraceae bacterium]
MSGRSLAALKRGDGSAKPSAAAQPPGQAFNIGAYRGGTLRFAVAVR